MPMNTDRAVEIAREFESLINEGDYFNLGRMVGHLVDKHGFEVVHFAFEFLDETAEWADEDAEDRFNRLWKELETLACGKV